MKRKVCIIGLDGMGFQNLHIFLDRLSLNSLSRVVNKGFVTSFISVPPYTPLSWTSIFTGVNPGKHGVYGFLKAIKSSYYFRVFPCTSFDVSYPRLFEILSMFNMRSVVINVPLTHPINGIIGLRNLVIISDWASPKQFIYPSCYEEKYKEYLVEPPHRWAIAVNEESYVKSVENYLKKRIHLYYDLLEEADFSLFIICLLYTSPSPRDLSTSRMPSSA